MFKKLNDIYLSANYLKTVSLNDCETSDDIDDLCVRLLRKTNCHDYFADWVLSRPCLPIALAPLPLSN